MVLPKRVADHRDRSGARLTIFLGSESPAQNRIHATNTEEITGDELALNGLADPVLIPTGKWRFRIECSEGTKRLIIISEINVRWITQAIIAFQSRAPFQIVPPYLPEFVRSLNGRRPNQQRVHEAEDRGVCGNSEAEREDGDRAESGIFQQHSDSVTKVSKQDSHNVQGRRGLGGSRR